jgi:hypothetical protein
MQEQAKKRLLDRLPTVRAADRSGPPDWGDDPHIPLL